MGHTQQVAIRFNDTKEGVKIAPDLIQSPDRLSPLEGVLERVHDPEPIDDQQLEKVRACTLEVLKKLLTSDRKESRRSDSEDIEILLAPKCVLSVDTSNIRVAGIEEGTTERARKITARVLDSRGGMSSVIAIEIPDSITTSRAVREIRDFFENVTTKCLDLARIESGSVGYGVLKEDFQAKLVEQLAGAFGNHRVIEALQADYPELKETVDRLKQQAKQRDEHLEAIAYCLELSFPKLSIRQSFGTFFSDNTSYIPLDLPEMGPVAIPVLLAIGAAYLGYTTVAATHTLAFGWRHAIRDKHHVNWSDRLLKAATESKNHGIDTDTALRLVRALARAAVSDCLGEERFTRPTAEKFIRITEYALKRLHRDSVESFFAQVFPRNNSADPLPEKVSAAELTKRVRAFFER